MVELQSLQSQAASVEVGVTVGVGVMVDTPPWPQFLTVVEERGHLLLPDFAGWTLYAHPN